MNLRFNAICTLWTDVGGELTRFGAMHNKMERANGGFTTRIINFAQGVFLFIIYWYVIWLYVLSTESVCMSEPRNCFIFLLS